MWHLNHLIARWSIFKTNIWDVWFSSYKFVNFDQHHYVSLCLLMFFVYIYIYLYICMFVRLCNYVWVCIYQSGCIFHIMPSVPHWFVRSYSFGSINESTVMNNPDFNDLPMQLWFTCINIHPLQLKLTSLFLLFLRCDDSIICFSFHLYLFLLLLFSVYLGALRKCTACGTCQVVSISQKAWAQLGWHGQCHGRSTSLYRWMGGDLCKMQRYHAEHEVVGKSFYHHLWSNGQDGERLSSHPLCLHSL